MLRYSVAILLIILVSGFNIIPKQKAMNAPTLQETLKALTNNLLYSTESDYPFEIIDLGNKRLQDFKNALAAPVEETTTDHFFSRYINILQSSGDPVREADVDRYKKLQSFINSHAATTTVLRSGRIEISVYVLITEKDGHTIALKTTSVET